MSPHPFFFAFLATLALAAVAFGLAGSNAPGYALHSNLIYRAEVGGVVLGIGYVVSLVGWLAWHGRAMRVEIGPATADPADAINVDDAASGFEDFRNDVYSQIEDLRTAGDELRKALEAENDDPG